jgi:hypothetical protein
MNSQISSRRRLALAALLMVLSASAVLAHVNNVRFQGAFDARETGVIEAGTLRVNGSGAGTASHLGRFTYTLNATVDLATNLSSGAFELVAGNGDLINGSFVGRAGPTDTPNVGHIIELMTISGGTGRFQGATGEFTFDRLVVLATLPAFTSSSGTLKGTISTPGSPK